MPSVVSFFRDFGGDVVSTGIPVDSGATLAEAGALHDAMKIWSRGANDGGEWCQQLEARVGNAATDPDAQSGVYGYIVMKDSVNGRSYKERLPMPDLAKVPDIDTDPAWLSEVDTAGNSISVANPLHADYAVLKTAIEAVYLSPEGNAGTLVKVYVPNRL